MNATSIPLVDQYRPKIFLHFIGVSLFAVGYFIFSQNIFAISGEFAAQNSDVAMHSIWIGKYVGENQYVDNDLLVEISEKIQPWGIYLLKRALIEFSDTVVYSYAMPIVLFFISCFFAYLFILRYFGWKVAAIGIVLLSNTLIEPSVGFHARAFSYPLLFAFLYFYSGRDYKSTAIVIVLATLFYPPALLICCGTAALYLGICLVVNRSWDLDKKAVIILAVSLAISIMILLAKSQSMENNQLIGEMYSKSELLQMEELGKDGRVMLHPQLEPLSTLLSQKLNKRLFSKIFFITFVAYLIFVGVRRKSLTHYDYLILSLACAGLTLFICARLFFFKLFIPFRYLEYTLEVFWYLVLIRGLSILVQRYSQALILPIAVVFSMYLSFIHFVPKNAGQKNLNEYAAVYEEARKLEPKSLIATTPAVADYIPYFAERSVLISYETSHLIYYRNYWSEIKQRYIDFYEAYSTTDTAVLESFIKKYNVDYIIVDRQYFDDGEDLGFEPVSSFVKQSRTGKVLSDYAILNIRGPAIAQLNERFSVLDCDKWITDRLIPNATPRVNAELVAVSF